MRPGFRSGLCTPHRESRRSILGRRGQATLEIILLLIILVAVILGLVAKFNSSFRAYTVDLYGGYYRCLLETGELPGTGSVCKDKQAAYDPEAGKDVITGGGGGDGSDGGGNGEDGGGNRGGGGTETTSNSGSGSGSSGDGNTETVSSGTSGGGQSVIARMRRTSRRNQPTQVGSADDLSKSELAMAGGSGEDEPSRMGSRSVASNNLRRSRSRTNFTMEGEEYVREETKAAVASGTVKKTNEAGSGLRPRRSAYVPPREKKDSQSVEGTGGFAFGNLVRMLFIIIIIVIIVVVVGGQVMQVANSGDKG